jgi:hypothetical protein
VYNIKFGLSVFLNYLCIPSPFISPDNIEYTLIPTIFFESPKGPTDEKYLETMNSLIRPWERTYSSYSFSTSALDGVSGQRHPPAAL